MQLVVFDNDGRVRCGDGSRGSKTEQREGAQANAFHISSHVISNPVSVPVLDAKRSTSRPSRCRIVVNKFGSGAFFVGLNARCWPCLKPPPATMIGRFS